MNINQTLKLSIVFLVYAIYYASAEDYCLLCESPLHHIACNNSGSFAEACSPDRRVIKMDDKLSRYILILHNRLRNLTASGNLSGFEPAKRMPLMLWSKELAYLAELNARRCIFRHDECRATKAFPFAGQNIAKRGNTASYERTRESVEKMINTWFGEYNDTTMEYINEFKERPDKIPIGHFTVMVNDKVNRIGCALISYQENEYKFNHLVCNYSYTNIWERPVYKTGSPGSECKTGVNSIYKSLCNANEEIIPFPYKD